MKDISSLYAISPVDGRYSNVTNALSAYFSEYALIKYRVYVEVQYFIRLVELELPMLNNVSVEKLTLLYLVTENFSIEDALKVKEIEKKTNHDVKAVEYFLQQKFDEIGMNEYKDFIHFGLTSQDINNTAIPMLLKEASEDVLFPAIDKLFALLKHLAEQWIDIPMLAHTHGQAASPTKLGKELMVFVNRIKSQYEQLKAVPFSAKFGGATGNFNAHKVAFPEVDWQHFANGFVEDVLQLSRIQVTTQIEPYDNMAAYFDALKRIHNILIDLCRDCWMYISMDYFKQKINKDEVGSSTMPHKVNPIDFENAEGNLGYANAICEHFAAKLPISRLQRDLTDSTVLRNIGVPLAHSLIALNSLTRGLNKLVLNEDKIHADLANNWVVVAEGIQTILRREAYPNPYEALKELTRTNKAINEETLAAFIDGLDVNEDIKTELKQITPFNYTGIF
ncbi:MAG: adenylosuccinate lyase [Bacteroidota bacterium]